MPVVPERRTVSRMHVLRTLAAVAGTVTLATLVACNPLAERRLEFSGTEKVKITEILVTPGSGDLTVRTGAVADVEIKRVIRYRTGDPEESNYRIEGSTLILDSDCGRRCFIDFDILAPTGVAVRGEIGSGDVALTAVAEVDLTVGAGNVTVSGASGAVRVKTGAGDIGLSRIPASVTAITSSGNIDGRDLGGGKVQAETGAGDVTLALATPGSVQVNTSSGSVNLAVPAGRYRVLTETDPESARVDVPDDPTASAVLEVRASSGDVIIRQTG